MIVVLSLIENCEEVMNSWLLSSWCTTLKILLSSSFSGRVSTDKVVTVHMRPLEIDWVGLVGTQEFIAAAITCLYLLAEAVLMDKPKWQKESNQGPLQLYWEHFGVDLAWDHHIKILWNLMAALIYFILTGKPVLSPTMKAQQWRRDLLVSCGMRISSSINMVCFWNALVVLL